MNTFVILSSLNGVKLLDYIKMVDGRQRLPWYKCFQALVQQANVALSRDDQDVISKLQYIK